MRTAALALVVSGCSFAAAVGPGPARSQCSRALPALEVVGGLTTIALAALVATRCRDAGVCSDFLVDAFLIGPITLTSGIYGLATIGECDSREQEALERERLAAENAERVVRRERAWQAIKVAQQRARANDCAQAFAIADEVRELDEEMFDVVLRRDAAFARCSAACPEPTAARSRSAPTTPCDPGSAP
jgi:hypothetical protein